MSLPFHPLVSAWFTETYGKPTAVQEEAWPLIAAGKDILAIAPTGSGKTLTAFLAALSRFIEGVWNPEELCVLYVSPLKALNEDIRRNLVEPIEALKRRAEKATAETATEKTANAETAATKDSPLFRIRVETRSGDTPQSERRRFLLHPPSILAVTPESLAILLLNPRGREALSHIKYLVIDEIHAVMGTKRGAFLSCQIDRLPRNAASFQRVALSATVNPPELAAEFAGGLVREGGAYKKRPLVVVAPPAEKKIRFTVMFPPGPDNAVEENAAANAAGARYGARYAVLTSHILERISALRENKQCENKQDKNKQSKNKQGGNDQNRNSWNGSLLVFTDSRRRAERIAYLVNEKAGARLALCHHGSLSKELRREVEQSLVQGIAPCVIATSSLELGLDIGDVDEVILAGTPSSCARSLQRIGRSGHGVGEESRGILFPFHGMDLLLGAVMAGAVAEREIERVKPIKNPLDILSQIALALCTEAPRTPDQLFEIIRGFAVFSDLARSSFDQVIAMLTGKYFHATQGNGGAKNGKDALHADDTEGGAGNTRVEEKRLRELKPLLYQDIPESGGENSVGENSVGENSAGKLYAAEGALALLYSSGGVIASRGLYSMRLPDGTKIGELDEEFVWERRIGESFDFGARSWRIAEIGSEAVIVNPLAEAANYQPFWTADTAFRSAELCRRTLEFFDTYNASGVLPNRDMLSTEAAAALEEYLFRQREAQKNIPLPDQKNIPVEIIDDPALRPDSFQVLFHTFRGGAVNYPLAMAISSLLEEKTGIRCEAIPDDNAVLIQLPRLAAETYSGRPDPLLLIKDCVGSLASGGEGYFKKRLEASGVFGAAFREAAERSMILPRGIFGRRIPLWVIRQRAKRLYDRVSSCGDFPAITEAWRSCLADTFDMESFRALLEDLSSGAAELNFFQNAGPSPFARNLSWMEINSFMYEYDERKDLLGGGNRSLADRAVADALNDPSLRPQIKAAVAASFTARQRREIPGYAPEETLSLSQWVKDRVAIPHDEWQTLAGALPPELQEQLAADPSLGGRLRILPSASLPLVIHAESVTLLEDGLLTRLGEWLSFEGPVLPERVAEVFCCTFAEAEDALDALVETGEAVKEISVEGSGENCYCDAENYELLLRLNRKKARPQIRERPPALLVPFIAFRQGLIGNAGSNSLSNSIPLSTNSPPNIPLLGETLSCYSAPIRLWETEIFPARDARYRPEKLDAALKEGRLVWFGAGRERAAFAFPEELELADFFSNDRKTNKPKTGKPETNKYGIAKTDTYGKANVSRAGLFPLLCELCAAYRNFWEIKDTLEAHTKSSLSSAELSAVIWEASWRGLLSSDTWEGLRRGVERGFDSGLGAEKNSATPFVSGAKLQGIAPAYRAAGRERRLPRALKERWREGAPVPGRIFSLVPELSGEFSANSPAGNYAGLYGASALPGASALSGVSALERDEINRDRVRLLLRRWGILCRPLLETEALFSWAELLPAMRRMELAGELVTGRFFENIPSLQFASPSIAEELEAAEALAGASTGWAGASAGSAGRAAPVYWMNAADPASPAGWNIAGLDPRLPARSAASRLCFRGKELAAVSSKSGKELEVFVDADDPQLREILAFVVLPRTRACHPVKKIALETINGKPAAETPCAPLLAEMGFISDRGKLFLW